MGYGLSTCATCDGAFHRGHDVLVVGGDDSAMEEALFLAKFADSVTAVHRCEELRASDIMVERTRDHAAGVPRCTRVGSDSGIRRLLQ